MKILVVGGGGREHALVWKLADSPRVTQIFAAPGNGGIADLATCVDIAPEDVRSLCRFAWERRVDLTVVGPEGPLAAGIVDHFRAQGLRIFGPTERAARIESSKAFAKRLMRRHGIPTADFRIFDDARRAHEYVHRAYPPIVVKACGLAAGKGVVVCRDPEAAEAAVDRMMVEREFGDAGKEVVVETFLTGDELSFLAVTDGRTIATLEPVQDFKPVDDGGTGPNTGGMGAYSPFPLSGEDRERIEEKILVPTVHAMRAEGHPFEGVLFAGLMLTPTGPRVLEYNCRLGDPEAQTLLARLKTDLLEILEATIDGRLEDVHLAFDPRPAVTVVLAAKGYPGSYPKGQEITGLADAAAVPNVHVFHAGTRREGDRYYTAGGRVVAVTALGTDLAAARATAYQAVSRIRWQDVHYRTDIARTAAEQRGSEGRR